MIFEPCMECMYYGKTNVNINKETCIECLQDSVKALDDIIQTNNNIIKELNKEMNKQ